MCVSGEGGRRLGDILLCMYVSGEGGRRLGDILLRMCVGGGGRGGGGEIFGGRGEGRWRGDIHYVCVCVCVQAEKGMTGDTGLMGLPGDAGEEGEKVRRSHVLCDFFFCTYMYVRT